MYNLITKYDCSIACIFCINRCWLAVLYRNIGSAMGYNFGMNALLVCTGFIYRLNDCSNYW